MPAPTAPRRPTKPRAERGMNCLRGGGTLKGGCLDGQAHSSKGDTPRKGGKPASSNCKKVAHAVRPGWSAALAAVTHRFALAAALGAEALCGE